MSDAVDRAAEVLEVHQVEFIDHEVGYECGCNEHGDGHPDGLRFQSDALRHQAQALDEAGLLASDERDADALLVEVTRLRGVVQGMLRLTEAQPVHAYAGLCPDVSQPNTFDPECPACAVIVEAAGMTSTEGSDQ